MNVYEFKLYFLLTLWMEKMKNNCFIDMSWWDWYIWIVIYKWKDILDWIWVNSFKMEYRAQMDWVRWNISEFSSIKKTYYHRKKKFLCSFIYLHLSKLVLIALPVNWQHQIKLTIVNLVVIFIQIGLSFLRLMMYKSYSS